MLNEDFGTTNAGVRGVLVSYRPVSVSPGLPDKELGFRA